MPEIKKVYREKLPAAKLVGKRYTNADRDSMGGFGSKWGECFGSGLFEKLEAQGSLPENQGAYMGCMRETGGFEYWIGMFMPADAPVPEGLEAADIPAGDVGVCWLYGRDDTGELYGQEPHEMCMREIRNKGWKIAAEPWFFERYDCVRFNNPDEFGNVILDYGIYIEPED